MSFNKDFNSFKVGRLLRSQLDLSIETENQFFAALKELNLFSLYEQYRKEYISCDFTILYLFIQQQYPGDVEAVLSSHNLSLNDYKLDTLNKRHKIKQLSTNIS